MKKKTKRYNKAFIIITALFVMSCVLAFFFYTQSNWIFTTNYTVSSKKIPKEFNGYKILQLSDLHSMQFGKDNIRLIKKIDKIKPDIIAVTGDVLNSQNDDGRVFLSLAERLAKKYTIYYIVGNHEQIVKNRCIKKKLTFFNDYMEKLKSFGIIIVDDSSDRILKKGACIDIYGLDIPLKYYKGKNSASYEGEKEFSVEEIKDAVGECESGTFSILLAHDPKYFSLYDAWGADLTLSGHVHGGVIWLPFVGGLLSPEQSFFPEYDKGRFERNGKVMIVNAGLGNSIVKIPRFLVPPELSVITLKSK